MRYFKYDNPTPPETAGRKEQYAALTKAEAKLRRRKKIMNILGWIVFFVIFLGGFIASFFLPDYLLNRLDLGDFSVPISIIIGVLLAVVSIVFEFVAFILCAILGMFAALPLWGPCQTAYRNTEKQQKQELLSHACAHLCEFYELQEPCLVTKCYGCTDKRFKDHDVCLFVVGDELRITTNLKHGFLDLKRDLGCYAFKAAEISLSFLRDEKRPAAELKTDTVTFLLGQRAKSFIETHFLTPTP